MIVQARCIYFITQYLVSPSTNCCICFKKTNRKFIAIIYRYHLLFLLPRRIGRFYQWHLAATVQEMDPPRVRHYCLLFIIIQAFCVVYPVQHSESTTCSLMQPKVNLTCVNVGFSHCEVLAGWFFFSLQENILCSSGWQAFSYWLVIILCNAVKRHASTPTQIPLSR